MPDFFPNITHFADRVRAWQCQETFSQSERVDKNAFEGLQRREKGPVQSE